MELEKDKIEFDVRIYSVIKITAWLRLVVYFEPIVINVTKLTFKRKNNIIKIIII